jgi:hypothetical protein
MILTGENRNTRGKTCPNATLSTTYPTWTDPGWNPSLHDERPATNRLSHGTAFAADLLSWELRGIPFCLFSVHFFNLQMTVISLLADTGYLLYMTQCRDLHIA